MGWVLNREIVRFRAPTTWARRKAISGASLSRDAFGLCVVIDPMHVLKLLARNPGDPVVGHALSAWSARPKVKYSRDERQREV